MANERPGFRRVDIELAVELVEAIDKAAGPGQRTQWIAAVLARAAKLKLPPDRLAPKRGPRGPRKVS